MPDSDSAEGITTPIAIARRTLAMQTVLLCCLALFAPTAALRAGFLPRWSSPVANSAAASRTATASMEVEPEKLRVLTSEGTV